MKHTAKERGQGLNALADFAGVSRSQLYDVLACRKAPTIDWVAKIADVLRVEPCELLSQKARRPQEPR